ncbi:hypothetical protein AHZ37_001869 [Salmonella enterica subsp. indica]|uniref:Membrane protein n=1 Tax=Salmonella enterica subsp. indica TaxID=59207 RepID=A0A379XWK9_SALER|nr:hypothetical protein [Salmonella enterica]EBP3214002.1 hypothetical protein [Salmonella enterica subsp. arizonae]ECI8271951.1 hypothetical protein [Salmonella enterica subsp. enterica]EDR2771288.1 hypothetical protein [Salmonella enterica subsp. enterica serovar Oslo]EEC4248108.1 hypothetical protein [Salmonella enterica subsp. diarizonae]ECC3877378.1 hypothetical protein [Salmonella enterica subsp. indica]
MSLKNVHKSVMIIALLCGMSGMPTIAQADDGECEMMSAVKIVDFGRYRKEEMQKGSTEYVGKVYNGYASVTREFQVSVICPDVRKMRISINGAARQNRAYRFTDSGAMKIAFKDGRVDGTTVQLATADIGSVAVQGGESEVTLPPEKALVAVNGTEVAGKQFVATMMVTTYLSDNAFSVSNSTDLTETLTLNVDTLPAQ